MSPAEGGTPRVYVYYRVAEDTVAVRDRAAAWLAAVAAATGIRGTLLARCDDPATWMEVYEPVGHAGEFLHRLEALARSHDAAALARDGRRHVECFAPLPRMPGMAPRTKGDPGVR